MGYALFTGVVAVSVGYFVRLNRKLQSEREGDTWRFALRRLQSELTQFIAQTNPGKHATWQSMTLIRAIDALFEIESPVELRLRLREQSQRAQQLLPSIQHPQVMEVYGTYLDHLRRAEDALSV